ncbi:hypothetical protein REPUB_Repub15cG0109200 [Reevesia pubescens]
MKKKLPDIATLRGPSNATWTVELSSNGDSLFFKNGWPEFVKDNCLEENDLLIFKFNGELSFDVLIFDTSNFSENEASYFVPGGGKAARDSKNWQEEIYWIRFQCISFFSLLSVGFHERFAIPKKFATKMRKKLPEIVVLRGPSGATWTVELRSNGETFFFTNGWSEFVKDLSLEGNDLLIFRFNGDSSFDVLVFDPSTLCEKEVLYFVQKGGGKAAEDGKKRSKRQMKETYVQVESSEEYTGSSSSETSGNEDSFISPSETSASDDSTCPVQSSRPYSYSNVSSKIIWSEVANVTNLAHSRRAKSTAATSIGENSGVKLKNPSNERPVTVRDKHDAIMAATEAANSNSDSLLVVMRSRHVENIFTVPIPSRWMAKHVTPETKTLILRAKGKEYYIGFYYDKTNKTGQLTHWKHFALKNNMKVFNVCVFTPAGRSEDGTLILDVKIFPVVKEEVPPTPK